MASLRTTVSTVTVSLHDFIGHLQCPNIPLDIHNAQIFHYPAILKRLKKNSVSYDKWLDYRGMNTYFIKAFVVY